MRRPSLYSLPLSSASLAAVTALLLMPVLMVLASWLQWDMDSAAVLREMAQTVLPDYAATSVLLCLMVGIGVVVLGSGTALAVSLFDFPGNYFRIGLGRRNFGEVLEHLDEYLGLHK